MAENLTPQRNIELVREMLSPYLDDEVSDDERALVDAALAGSPELRNELESLRQTVALVADLPRVPAPRPFTLTQADVQAVAPKPKKWLGLPAWFGGFAAAAALLVCVLAAGGLFLTGRFGSGGMAGDIAMAPQQAAEEAAMEQPAAEAPAEEPAAEEAAPVEEEVLMAAEVAEEEAPAEKELFTVEVEKEAVVEEKAAVESTIAPAPAEAVEDTANLAGEAEADRSGMGEGGSDMQAMPTPTPAALTTTTPSPAPTSSPAPPALAVSGITSDTAASTAEEEMPEESVVAEAPAVAATEAATVAATPSPTVVALLTILPSNTPEVQATPAQIVEPASPADARNRTSFFIGIIILLMIVVIAIGVAVRWSKK